LLENDTYLLATILCPQYKTAGFWTHIEPDVESPQWHEWFELKERKERAETVLKERLDAQRLVEARTGVFISVIF
jgi:hypothetical protein